MLEEVVPRWHGNEASSARAVDMALNDHSFWTTNCEQCLVVIVHEFNKPSVIKRRRDSRLVVSLLALYRFHAMTVSLADLPIQTGSGDRLAHATRAPPILVGMNCHGYDLAAGCSGATEPFQGGSDGWVLPTQAVR